MATALQARSRWRRWRAPISTFLAHFYMERLTRPGRFVLIGSVATGIAAGFPDKMVGTPAFSFFASLAAVSLLICVARRPEATVQRRLAERCMEGRAVTMTLRVRNESARTLLDIGAYEFRLPRRLKLLDETSYVDRLAPGQSHDFEYRLWPRRRGHYTLHGPTALSSFPFALTHSTRFQRDPHRLVVYPRFHPLRALRLAGGQRYQPGGVSLLSKVGESMEFIGNREYRAGDRLRDLHPRSWARVGHPVVRQFQEEFVTRVALFVDTYLPWRWKPMLRHEGKGFGRLLDTQFIWGLDSELLEANLSLAASVADYLARGEYVVDWFAAGPQLYHFQSGRSLAHLENILDILACIERAEEDPLDVVGAAFSEGLSQTSTVVALLMHWDKRRAEFIESIRATGVGVKVVVLSDDADVAAAATAAGAMHLNVSLARAGVEEL